MRFVTHESESRTEHAVGAKHNNLCPDPKLYKLGSGHKLYAAAAESRSTLAHVRALAIGVLVAVAAMACKDKQPQQSPAPTAPAAPAPSTTPAGTAPTGSGATAATDERPKEATAPRQPLGDPLSLEDAAKVIPALAGKEILPLRQTSDKRQVHATWCLDGTSADDVAKQVGKQMAQVGFKELSIRGDARKAGVQGARDGFRMSMIISASSAANCPAPQHYFGSATIFREPPPP